MSQTKLDPRLLDSAVALPAMSGAALTGLASDFVLLATNTPSTASTSDFTAFDNATYSRYEFHYYDLTTSVDGNNLGIRFSTDAGSSFISSTSYYHATREVNEAGSLANQTGSGSDRWYQFQGANWGSASNEKASGVITIHDPGASTWTRGNCLHNYSDDQAGTNETMGVGAGTLQSASAVDGLRFLLDSGSMTGTIKMYGVK